MNGKDLKKIVSQFPMKNVFSFIARLATAAVELAAMYVGISYIVDDRLSLKQTGISKPFFESGAESQFDFNDSKKRKPTLETGESEKNEMKSLVAPPLRAEPGPEKALTTKDAR